MLKIIFSFCVVAIFLAGCSSKENDSLLSDFKNNQDKFEQIQKTNKVRFLCLYFEKFNHTMLINQEF